MMTVMALTCIAMLITATAQTGASTPSAHRGEDCHGPIGDNPAMISHQTGTAAIGSPCWLPALLWPLQCGRVGMVPAIQTD